MILIGLNNFSCVMFRWYFLYLRVYERSNYYDDIILSTFTFDFDSRHIIERCVRLSDQVRLHLLNACCTLCSWALYHLSIEVTKWDRGNNNNKERFEHLHNGLV